MAGKCVLGWLCKCLYIDIVRLCRQSFWESYLYTYHSDWRVQPALHLHRLDLTRADGKRGWLQGKDTQLSLEYISSLSPSHFSIPSSYAHGSPDITTIVSLELPSSAAWDCIYTLLGCLSLKTVRTWDCAILPLFRLVHNTSTSNFTTTNVSQIEEFTLISHCRHLWREIGPLGCRSW